MHSHKVSSRSGTSCQTAHLADYLDAINYVKSYRTYSQFSVNQHIPVWETCDDISIAVIIFLIRPPRQGGRKGLSQLICAGCSATSCVAHMRFMATGYADASDDLLSEAEIIHAKTCHTSRSLCKALKHKKPTYKGGDGGKTTIG